MNLGKNEVPKNNLLISEQTFNFFHSLKAITSSKIKKTNKKDITNSNTNSNNMKRSKSSKGNHARMHRRLNEALKEENYYEALQIYKLIATRAVESGDTKEARKSLMSGIQKMASAGEATSVDELFELLLRTYPTYKFGGDASKATPSKDAEQEAQGPHLEKEDLIAFQELFTAISDLKARNRWLGRVVEDVVPAAQRRLQETEFLSLEIMLADTAEALGDYNTEVRYLIRACAAPERIATAVDKLIAQELQGDPDVQMFEQTFFYGKVVLQAWLSCPRGALAFASNLYGEFAPNLVDMDASVPPLFNFIRFALVLAKTEDTQDAPLTKAAAFAQLRAAYAKVLDGYDPFIGKLVDDIGLRFFGVQKPQQQPPNNGMGDFLGGMFRSMMGGLANQNTQN